ncbi:ComEC/Rec2 family competence protein [Nesterenkonia sp. HG001]|uniref:ComEC/Rec2 family competence protein n=1 Tax=Nesterenkonia sp. HG001 TaxID=2983207 RepID=UPI002AC3D01C|nr:ComEC/Rec2 family competence protein [Nesterenkonia sp. HG001]MDZ5077909.1 ComEC/Rec2 family competence protein [Nesterenkonia sp. HG001]
MVRHLPPGHVTEGELRRGAPARPVPDPDGDGLRGREAGHPARPVDLRLLPAALVAWGAAWITIQTSVATALGLGVLLGGVGALLLGVLVLLHRMMSPDRWAVLAAVQVAVCCVAGGSVALSAHQTHQRVEVTGWEEAVEAEVPIRVELRVVGAPREAARPGPDGAGRAVVRARVSAFEHRSAPPEDHMAQGEDANGSSASHVWRHVQTDAVLLLDADAATELQVGERLHGLVRPIGTEPGDRATALLIPFGVDALTPSSGNLEDEERAVSRAVEWWSEIRRSVRDGTIEASGPAAGDAPELLPGLILGDRSGQGHDLTESMRAAGMTHLTVVSGTHCALVMGAFLGLLRLLRTPRLLGLLLALLGLVLYVGLVDPAPSVIRAAVMGALGALALFSGRRRASFSLLCVCVLGMLIWDPHYAVEPAMQLSAAATAGIILTGARIQDVLKRVLPGILAGPAALALSAQLFVTPVLLPLSGGLTTYAVPANILASPLLPFVTVPGLFGALLSPVVPDLAGGLLWLCGFPAAAIGWIGRRASALPQAVAPWPDGLTGVALVVAYVIAVVLLARRLVTGLPSSEPAQTEGRRHAGPRSGPPRRTVLGLLRSGAPVWSCAAVAGALTALVLPGRLPGATGAPEGWSVVMCDVGQGDMLVVRSGARSAVVVDAGEEPHLADDCLSRLQVETVDTLFITHEHRDHYGGVPGVIEGRAVHEVLYGGSADWTPRAEPELETALDDVRVRRVGPGETSESGRSAGEPSSMAGEETMGAGLSEARARWQVWLAHQHYPEPNDNSLVVLFELEDGEAESQSRGGRDDPWRLLATGDLEEDAARLAIRTGALPEHVDILKVAHHGAANGGTETLESTTPEIALIGVGEDNSYGHPAPSIRQALGEAGTSVYRTDLHGGIVLRLGEDEIEVESLGAVAP